MTFLKALRRSFLRPAVTPVAVPTAVTPPARTPLETWSDAALLTWLANMPTGSKVGYFACYSGRCVIEDFTGSYVTLTAEAD